jgi:hypothetical protein
MVPIHAADYFTHLALGRYIAENGVPRTEPFLYPCQGRGLIAFEWLAELLLYRGYQIWGHGGMQLAKAAVGAGIFCLVLLTSRLRGAGLAVAGGVTVWAVLAGQHRLMVRPHLISWLVVAAIFWVLHAGWPWRRTVAVLVVGAVLLANLHGSAVIAAGIVGLFGLSCVVTPGGHGRQVSETRRRGWWLMAAAAAMMVASVINPRGLALITYPFRPVDAADVRSVVQEWKAMPPLVLEGWPPSLMDQWPSLLLDRWPFWLMAIVMLGSPFVYWRVCRRRPTLLELVLPLGMVFLAIWMRRFGLLMAILCGPILAGQLSALIMRWSGRRGRAARAAPGAFWTFWLVAAVVMMLFGGEVRRPARGIAGHLFPVKAVNWMAGRDDLCGPMFANYEWGGYIHWHLFPRGCQTLIDGRTWDYPRELFEDYSRIMQRQPGWLAKLDDYGAIVRLERWRPQTVGPAKNRYSDPGWVIVYWDDNDVVLVRDIPRFKALIRRFDSSLTFPPVVLARAEWGAGELALAAAGLSGKLEQDEGCVMAAVALGKVLTEMGQYDRAVATLQRAIDADPALHVAWVRLCIAHMLAGHPDRALAASRGYMSVADGDEGKRKALRLVVNSAQGAGDLEAVAEGLDRYLRFGPADKWHADMKRWLAGRRAR